MNEADNKIIDKIEKLIALSSSDNENEAEAGREFGRNEKMNYVEGFNAGLHQNFEDQKKQSETFALACLVPAEVNAFVDEIPGMEEYQEREFERSREHDLLRQYGYIDGKNFQNAGDKERLAE